MALVQTTTWANLTQAMLNNAFTYAGGTLATIHAETGAAPGTTVTGWCFYVGEGTTSQIGAFAIGGSSNKCFASALSAAGSAFGGSAGKASDTVRVVATKTAVAIMNPDANGVSKMGLVISKDNAGALCSVVIGADSATLDDPAVVPWNAAYTTKIQYMVSASRDFNCTSIAKIPVPSFDGTARYLPSVSFAAATQFCEDGKVTLNNLTYYNLGGAWFLRDTA